MHPPCPETLHQAEREGHSLLGKPEPEWSLQPSEGLYKTITVTPNPPLTRLSGLPAARLSPPLECQTL